MTKFKINDFYAYKQSGQKITMLTVYDYFSAAIADSAGIEVILVGDSLGMVIQGKATTISVKVKDMIYHTKAVKNGAPQAFILVDMPYLSYHNDIKTTVKNASKIIQQTEAQAVKLEINHCDSLKHVEALIAAQIPVIGHLGLTPQSVNMFGGFKRQGLTKASSEKIIDLARKLEHVGASAVVLECIPQTLAKEITQILSIPTIGIGSGKYCDGQVLVFNDMLGMNTGKIPTFVKEYLKGGILIKEAIEQYVSEVKNGEFPVAKND